MPKTMEDAFKRHIGENPTIFAVDPAVCAICRKMEELRCGVCFECKELIAITDDWNEVYEIKNPENRWPYVYRVGNPC